MLLIIIYLSFISIGFPNSLLGAAWPSMFEGLAVPDAYLGIVSLVVMAFTVVTCTYSGKLFKRFDAGVLTAVSISFIAISLIGFGVSAAFPLLCVWAVPLGLGIGVIDAGLNNYVAAFFKAKHMNWLHCFWGLGAALAPIVLSLGITRYDSWRSAYFIIGGALLGLALVLFSTLRLWKRAEEPEQAEEPGKTKFGELFRLRGAMLSLAAFFCYCSMEAAVGLWGSSYLVIAKNIASETAAQWLSVYFLGITAGRLLSGFLTMKLNSRQMVRLGYMLFAGGVAMLFLPLGNVSFWGGFALMGLGCAPIFPNLIQSTPEYFGRAHSQSVIGLQVASAYIGSTVMPPLFGVVATRVGYDLLPVFLGVLLIGMTVMIEVFYKRGGTHQAGI